MDGITDFMDMGLSKLWEMVKDREARHAAVHEFTESDMTEQFNNSNNVNRKYVFIYILVHVNRKMKILNKCISL